MNIQTLLFEASSISNSNFKMKREGKKESTTKFKLNDDKTIHESSPLKFVCIVDSSGVRLYCYQDW